MSESILCHWWRYSPLARKLKVQTSVCHSYRPKVIFVLNRSRTVAKSVFWLFPIILDDDFIESFQKFIELLQITLTPCSAVLQWLLDHTKVRVSFIKATRRSVSASSDSNSFRGLIHSFFSPPQAPGSAWDLPVPKHHQELHPPQITALLWQSRGRRAFSRLRVWILWLVFEGGSSHANFSEHRPSLVWGAFNTQSWFNTKSWMSPREQVWLTCQEIKREVSSGTSSH